MAIVIPAILEQTPALAAERAQQLVGVAQLAQFDVMDGEFVPNITVRDPQVIASLPLQFELHLMIEKPELSIQRWALPNVQRLIVHYEAADNISHLIEVMQRTGKQVAIAINPETSTHVLKPYIDKLDMVLVMGVEPGFSGQTFQRDVLEKIREIKLMHPGILVEVDGGVNAQTAPDIVAAGCDVLAASSFIWKSPDPAAAIAELQAL